VPGSARLPPIEALALRLALAMLPIGCGGQAAADARAPTCPPGSQIDAARTAALGVRLARHPEGARLLSQAGGLRTVCYGALRHSVITEEGVVLLRSDLGQAEAAARFAHLLHHRVEGMPTIDDPADGRGCDERVAEALDREARALALELSLRQSFGVQRPVVRLGVEGRFREAEEGVRLALLRDWLEAHPDGAQGLDALATGYRRRCEHGRPTVERVP